MELLWDYKSLTQLSRIKQYYGKKTGRTPFGNMRECQHQHCDLWLVSKTNMTIMRLRYLKMPKLYHYIFSLLKINFNWNLMSVHSFSPTCFFLYGLLGKKIVTVSPNTGILLHSKSNCLSKSNSKTASIPHQGTDGAMAFSCPGPQQHGRPRRTFGTRPICASQHSKGARRVLGHKQELPGPAATES